MVKGTVGTGAGFGGPVSAALMTRISRSVGQSQPVVECRNHGARRCFKCEGPSLHHSVHPSSSAAVWAGKTNEPIRMLVACGEAQQAPPLLERGPQGALTAVVAGPCLVSALTSPHSDFPPGLQLEAKLTISSSARNKCSKMIRNVPEQSHCGALTGWGGGRGGGGLAESPFRLNGWRCQRGHITHLFDLLNLSLTGSS